MEKLEKENKDLKEALEFKSDLISMTAHQLRTSMSAIKWVLKMLLDGDLGPVTQEQKIFLKKTQDNNEKMINFVSEMIDINKEENTEMSYKFDKCNLKEIVLDVIDDFKGEASKKGIELICDCANIEKPIEVDKDKMIIVLQGLIENAIKYNKENGFVKVSTKEDGDSVIISVEDNGMGIAEKEQDKIFEKFFRSSDAKKRDSMGSGLGLFVIKRILDKHNGEIWFESQENKGSTFFVRLPFSHK